MIMGDRPNPRCKKGKWLSYCGRTASSCGDWCPDFIKPTKTISDFRSKVEEIQCEVCGVKNCEYGSMLCEANKIETNRICALVAELAEGMPTILNPYEYVQDQCPGEYKIIEKAIKEQRTECQAYLKKEAI